MNDTLLAREHGSDAQAPEGHFHSASDAASTRNADARLTIAQARALLERLASDDDFRAHFANKPAAALSALGVEAETIVQLAAPCLERGILAPKDDFKKLLRESADDTVCSAMQMQVPKIGFTAPKV